MHVELTSTDTCMSCVGIVKVTISFIFGIVLIPGFQRNPTIGKKIIKIVSFNDKYKVAASDIVMHKQLKKKRCIK